MVAIYGTCTVDAHVECFVFYIRTLFIIIKGSKADMVSGVIQMLICKTQKS